MLIQTQRIVLEEFRSWICNDGVIHLKWLFLFCLYVYDQETSSWNTRAWGTSAAKTVSRGANPAFNPHCVCACICVCVCVYVFLCAHRGRSEWWALRADWCGISSLLSLSDRRYENHLRILSFTDIAICHTPLYIFLAMMQAQFIFMYYLTSGSACLIWDDLVAVLWVFTECQLHPYHNLVCFTTGFGWAHLTERSTIIISWNLTRLCDNQTLVKYEHTGNVKLAWNGN